MNVIAPTNIKQFRRCVGVLAYLAKWIPYFSTKIKPLISIKVTFPLNAMSTEAFSELKSSLCKACSKLIDENEPFALNVKPQMFQ